MMGEFLIDDFLATDCLTPALSSRAAQTARDLASWVRTSLRPRRESPTARSLSVLWRIGMTS